MKCSHDPLRIAESVCKIIENTPVLYEGHELSVTVSVGISVASSITKHQLSHFINHADKAMYQSKALGKNRTTLKKTSC